jgi:hypothetical protein
MRRRTYLSAVGASIGIPLGVGGGTLTQLQETDHDPDRLDPIEFREQLPDPLERHSLKEVEEFESNDAGKIINATYTTEGWGTRLQFLEKRGPQITVSAHLTHYHTNSMRDAIERLASFFRRVEVEYEHPERYEYLTYTIGKYSIRMETDFERSEETPARAWVNGKLHTFEGYGERNEFVNELIQQKLE